MPLYAERDDVGIDNAHIAATEFFSPCYIGGWSAVEHWGLTEQSFRSIMVMTSTKPRHTNVAVGSTKFKLKNVSKTMFFDLYPQWYENCKVYISSPHKTMADVLLYPELYGSMREVRALFSNYIASKFVNLSRLIKCCKSNGRGVAFKRLGWLLEVHGANNKPYISECQKNMSSGYSNIDPRLKCNKIITRWRLRVPASWHTEFKRTCNFSTSPPDPIASRTEMWARFL